MYSPELSHRSATEAVQHRITERDFMLRLGRANNDAERRAILAELAEWKLERYAPVEQKSRSIHLAPTSESR